MPVIQDIREAITRGDKVGAQALYDEVLAKNDGKGLSGHDQQILQDAIDLLGIEEAPAEAAEKPKARSRSAKAKVDQETGEVVAE